MWAEACRKGFEVNHKGYLLICSLNDRCNVQKH